MAYRIIDLTEKTTVTGTESIPGTEQTSTSDVTPANKRWVWNTIKDWILGYVSDSQKTFYIGPTSELSDYVDIHSQAIVGVNVCDSGIGGLPDANFKIKIGTTVGGNDIVDELIIEPSDTNGYRVSLSYSTASTKRIYVTEYGGSSNGLAAVCLEIKKIYL